MKDGRCKEDPKRAGEAVFGPRRGGPERPRAASTGTGERCCVPRLTRRGAQQLAATVEPKPGSVPPRSDASPGVSLKPGRGLNQAPTAAAEPSANLVIMDAVTATH